MDDAVRVEKGECAAEVSSQSGNGAGGHSFGQRSQQLHREVGRAAKRVGCEHAHEVGMSKGTQ